MYRKLRIGLKDIWKLLFGGRLLIKNPYDNDKVYTIQKGKCTYFTK